ncbi:uncharacterized protein EMH_0038350 [Eimeria mitis]|uniref:Uncharacterized protein n=1 Tax=Eimeria mitis TaxID=44415 RepID=U6KDZ3_9EIME|nr:uncharacterized protein EMH_0038350 [Eimeria mitis]CDJ36169.1 hypothetical protein, conserved [Eimeria mitis]
MASKADYLKKYLRGPRKPQGPPTGAQGGLRLGEDAELDFHPRSRRGGPRGAPGTRGRKTLFTVLRRAENGARYLFKDANEDGVYDEDLLASDQEEVRVVGEDGQILELSEADKAKVNELIAREEREDEDYPVKPRGLPTDHLSGLRDPRHARGRAPEGSPERAPEAVSEPPSPENSSWKEAFALEGPVCVGGSSHLSAPSPYDERARLKQQLELSGQLDPASRDLSPPRRRSATDRSGDLSPPRRRADTDGARDLSPPRRRADMDRDGDLSPPRRADRGRGISPPRRGADTDRDKDLSPPRRRPDADRDISPPRRRRPSPVTSRPAEAPRDSERNIPPQKNASREGRSEREATSEGDRDISPMRRSPSSKAGSQEDGGPPKSRIVFRDREGRIISEEEWLALEGAKGRKRQRERGPAPVLEWGAGLKQKEDKIAKQRREEKIAKQPFARYDIDEEYETELRARDRWDDPLARAPTSRKDRQEEQNSDTQDSSKTGKPPYTTHHTVAIAAALECCCPEALSFTSRYKSESVAV